MKEERSSLAEQKRKLLDELLKLDKDFTNLQKEHLAMIKSNDRSGISDILYKRDKVSHAIARKLNKLQSINFKLMEIDLGREV